MSDAEDVVCSGYPKCKDLPEDTVNVIYYGDKGIIQRPNTCSAGRPHRFNHEECGGMFCPFIKEWVECERIYQRIVR